MLTVSQLNPGVVIYVRAPIGACPPDYKDCGEYGFMTVMEVGVSYSWARFFVWDHPHSCMRIEGDELDYILRYGEDCTESIRRTRDADGGSSRARTRTTTLVSAPRRYTHGSTSSPRVWQQKSSRSRTSTAKRPGRILVASRKLQCASGHLGSSMLRSTRPVLSISTTKGRSSCASSAKRKSVWRKSRRKGSCKNLRDYKPSTRTKDVDGEVELR
jgi:hypothetical protein